ncbi:hypothetical protein BC829DRAFT_419996 [Chytridium lagenaria]|nr:hypothetical protein BC829DRAFT_419996 [Chytridium lagenaria]
MSSPYINFPATAAVGVNEPTTFGSVGGFVAPNGECDGVDVENIQSPGMCILIGDRSRAEQICNQYDGCKLYVCWEGNAFNQCYLLSEPVILKNGPPRVGQINQNIWVKRGVPVILDGVLLSAEGSPPSRLPSSPALSNSLSQPNLFRNNRLLMQVHPHLPWKHPSPRSSFRNHLFIPLPNQLAFSTQSYLRHWLQQLATTQVMPPTQPRMTRLPPKPGVVVFFLRRSYNRGLKTERDVYTGGESAGGLADNMAIGNKARADV